MKMNTWPERTRGSLAEEAAGGSEHHLLQQPSPTAHPLPLRFPAAADVVGLCFRAASEHKTTSSCP